MDLYLTVGVLTELYHEWNNNPNLKWDTSKDPCDDKWVGISCSSEFDDIDHSGYVRVVRM
jgi:hypothetical protein